MTEKLQRLAAAGIQLLPAIEITTHYVFERDGFVALVERTGAGIGGVGSAGILGELLDDRLVGRDRFRILLQLMSELAK